jgi:hypothetical protein
MNTHWRAKKNMRKPPPEINGGRRLQLSAAWLSVDSIAH